jgi:hypothetical protein
LEIYNMSIIQFTPSGTPGEVGVTPGVASLVTTANLAAITTAGYLSNSISAPVKILPTDIINVIYSYSTTTNTGTFGVFYPTFTSGVITLNQFGVNSTSIAGQTITTALTSATPGTVRSLTGKITESITTMTSGNIVGLRGEVDYVGASGGFVYGAQGKIIPTGTLSGSSWNAGVFGQLDISTATVNAGQTAPIWADYGTTSGTITDATGMRMFAGTNTTAATLNSMIYLYGKTSNLFELAANGSTYISTGGATASGTIKKIAILIEGVQYYLQAATVYS